MSSSQSEEWTMAFTREKNNTSNQNRERCFFTCEENDTTNQKPQKSVSFAPKFPPFLAACWTSLRTHLRRKVFRKEFFLVLWLILIRMAYKVLISPRCDIWHQLTWNVCTGGRTLRHNQIFSVGWFTKFSYPWCSQSARFARARAPLKRPPKWWMSQYVYNKHNTTCEVLRTVFTSTFHEVFSIYRT